MNELDQMQRAMDEFFAYLDNDVFEKEQKERDAEVVKENQHRKEEGL